MSSDTDLQLQSQKSNKAILICSVGNLERTSTLNIVTLSTSLQLKNLKTSIASIITNHLLLYPTTEIERIILVCNTQGSSTAQKGTCIFVEESPDNNTQHNTPNNKSNDTNDNTINKPTPNLQKWVRNDIETIIMQIKNKPKLTPIYNNLQKLLKRMQEKTLFYVVPLNTSNKQVNILEQTRQIYEAILKGNTNILLSDHPIDFIIDISHGLKWQPLAGYLISSLITGQIKLTNLLEKINSKKYSNGLPNLIITNIYTYIQTAKLGSNAAKNSDKNDTKDAPNTITYSTGEVTLIDSITKELSFATASETLYSQFNVSAFLQSAKNIIRTDEKTKSKFNRYLDDLTNMWEINALLPFDYTARKLSKELTEHLQNTSAYVNEITEYQIKGLIKFLNYITPKTSIIRDLGLNNFNDLFLEYLEKRLKLISLLINHNAYAKALLLLSEISIDFRIFLILSFHQTLTQQLLDQYLTELLTQTHCPNKQIDITRLKLANLLFQEKATLNIVLKECKQGDQVTTLRVILKLLFKNKKPDIQKMKDNNSTFTDFPKTEQLVQAIIQKIKQSDNEYYKQALEIVENIIESKKHIRNYIAHIGYIDVHKLNKFNRLINQKEKTDILNNINTLLQIINRIKNEYPAL